MEKEKEYDRVRFASKVIREASETFRRVIDPERQQEPEYRLTVQVDDTTWRHEAVEEFFADYNKGSGNAHYWEYIGYRHYLHLYFSQYGDTSVSVRSSDRAKIEAVFEVFEENVAESRLPEPPDQPPPPKKPSIFIGHGRSLLWRELKDHLQDQHNQDVIAYEVGARAGHAIRDILQDMLAKSSFAILVMTGEDETKNDEFQPRMNVVHELGLFQGRLGFSRAIVLLEEGTRHFSNIYGVEQIRFSKGNIKETFGDVLATLFREFPSMMDKPE